MPHLGRARNSNDAAVHDLWLTCRWLQLEEEETEEEEVTIGFKILASSGAILRSQ